MMIDMYRRGTRRPHLGLRFVLVLWLRFVLALCLRFVLALCACVLLEMSLHETRHPQPYSQEFLFNLITL